jgi:hypothetical protein
MLVEQVNRVDSPHVGLLEMDGVQDSSAVPVCYEDEI